MPCIQCCPFVDQWLIVEGDEDRLIGWKVVANDLHRVTGNGFPSELKGHIIRGTGLMKIEEGYK